jgi:hypothetical protein
LAQKLLFLLDLVKRNYADKVNFCARPGIRG